MNQQEEEAREVGRRIISDKEFNNTLKEITDNFFEKGLDTDLRYSKTTLVCVDTNFQDDSKVIKEFEFPQDMQFDENGMNDFGKRLFYMEVYPAAIFIVGYGDFYIEKRDGNGEIKEGLVVGGITLDSRTNSSYIEIAQGEKITTPVKRYLFPFNDDGKTRFNNLIWIFDGYAELMHQAEIQGQLAVGLMSIGLFRQPGMRRDE